MAVWINTNSMALTAQNSLGRNTNLVNRTMERLSSGSRINRTADDASGKAVSDSLINQIRSNRVAIQNAQDGFSILQIAEGSLQSMVDNLQRIRELSVQIASDTNGPDSRAAASQEIRTRLEEIDRLAQSTNFNGVALLDGSATNSLLQIGSNSDITTNTIDLSVALTSVRLDSNTPINGLGLIDSAGTFITSLDDIYDPVTGTAPVLNSNANLQQFMGVVDAALGQVTQQMSLVGSLQNRLDSTVNSLRGMVESFSASNSRIRDADIAQETSSLVQSQLLQQASVNVLAQANRVPEMTLRLLEI